MFKTKLNSVNNTILPKTQSTPVSTVKEEMTVGDMILKHIQYDTEVLRLTGMSHKNVRECIEDKYLGKDKNSSADLKGLIDLSLGKE